MGGKRLIGRGAELFLEKATKGLWKVARGRAKTVGDEVAVTPSRRIPAPSIRRAYRKAEGARDARLAELRAGSKRQQRKAHIVIGGHNIRTGESVYGQAAGSVRHAEDDVVQKLGGKVDEIYVSKPYNIIKGKEMPVCAHNCQPKYRPEMFPPETEFRIPGPWEKIYRR